MKKLLIIGAGGLGREVADFVTTIENIGREFDLIGFLDDSEDIIGTQINGVPVLGDSDYIINNYSVNSSDSASEKPYAVIAIADPDIKQHMVEKLSNYVSWANIIHPSARISSTSELGEGIIIQANTNITTNVTIGDHTLVNVQCFIGHDVIIEKYVSIMPICSITGRNHIKEKVFIGTGAVTIPSVVIGEESTIGAGAVVIRDVPNNATMVGNPAKRVK